MNRCDRCGRTLCAADEQVHLIEVEVGPCPEAPEGYGSEMELCDRCYVIFTEGLDQREGC
jgi:hypothetical protein